MLLRRAPSSATVSSLGCRRFCSAAPPDIHQAWKLFGLPPGTELPQIRRRFYKLAKLTHPDVIKEHKEGASEEGACFVKILAAFEILEEDALMSAASPQQGVRGSTAPNSAARGGGGGGGHRRQRRRPGVVRDREPTLGELLCERLHAEPAAAREVYDDIVAQQLSIRETMIDAIFRACGTKGGGGLPVAVEILRDAKERDLLTRPQRQAACISMIKWCKEDSSSFSRIVSEFGEEADRTPAERDTLAYANALYSGLSEGYSAT